MLKIKYLNNEKGVALITSIMLLSLLTIIGFSAMNSSDIELKIAGNERASTQTFNIAEAGIDHAFAKLSSAGNFASFSSYTQNNPYLYLEDVSLDSGKYNVWLTYVDDKHIKFKSHGSGGGNSVATIEVEIRSSEVNIPIPGAISCLGGPCIIDYNTGGGSPNDPNVSGHDHNPPLNFNCSGSNCRQYTINGPEGSDAKPAIFLDQGGYILQANNVNFWGGDFVENSGPTYINSGGAQEPPPTTTWGTPDSTDISNIGSRDNPQFSQISTSGARIERGAGILVIDNSNVEVEEDPLDIAIRGTSFFEGLIIIRNCGTLTASGTPHVYGAVLIDATGCGEDYTPFKGNGRPAVIYSSIALNNAFGSLSKSYKMSNWKHL